MSHFKGMGPLQRSNRFSYTSASRRIAIGLAMILVLSACGGSSSDDASETPVAGSSSDQATVTVDSDSALAGSPGASNSITDSVERNVAEHGDAGAFGVTVSALDQGYSVAQIVETPILGADGSIEGQQPAGSALGILVSGPQGVMAQSITDQLSDTMNLRVDFLSTTLEDIHAGAAGMYEEDAREVAPAETGGPTPAEYRLTYLVLRLIVRGYTPEQAIQGIVFGEFVFDGISCPSLPEAPEGVIVLGDYGLCPPIEISSPSTTATSDGESTNEPPVDNDARDAVGFEPGRFEGSAVDLLGDDSSGGSDEVIFVTDSVVATAEETAMSGVIELLVQATDTDSEEGDLTDLLSDTICFHLKLSFDDVPLTDPETGRFEGSATLTGAFEEGGCAGTPPSSTTTSATVAGQINGDTMTLTVTADGDTIDLVIDRV